MHSRHVSVVIAANPEAVYAFASHPEHLPKWAAGLAESPVTREGDVVRVDSPMGPITVRFTRLNDLGVLDHDVTLPSGETVTNPMRVVGHPEGAEVIFTLRQLRMSDDEFQRDVAMIEADLQRLKALLETVPGQKP